MACDTIVSLVDGVSSLHVAAAMSTRVMALAAALHNIKQVAANLTDINVRHR